MAKNGFYWHVHHDVLVEWCYDYDRRVEFIKEHKPANEVVQRLQFFRPVMGELPPDCDKAVAAYDKAVAACDKARAAYAKAVAAYDKAGAAYAKARAAYDKAGAACQPMIEALHAQECPNCIWDGKEMVFAKGGE